MYKYKKLLRIVPAFILGFILTAILNIAISNINFSKYIRIKNTSYPVLSKKELSMTPLPMSSVNKEVLGYTSCVNSLASDFNVNLDSRFSYRRQQIIYQMLDESKKKGARFHTLSSGSNISWIGTEGGSQQTGGKNISLGEYTSSGEDQFKVVFAHEMGHVIYWNSGSDAYQSLHREAWSSEGAVTNYGSSDITEDYAETIAYYLNPYINARTSGFEPNNPYKGGAHPLHYQVARTIIGGQYPYIP